MRIAVTSRSGLDIDQHFGQAERFLIYEVEPDRVELLDIVRVDKYCTADPEHASHDERFGAIAAALSGCTAVATGRIGPFPRKALQEEGILAFMSGGSIAATLREAFFALGGAGRC